MGPNRNPHWTHKWTEGYVIVSTIRRNIFTKDDGNFTADLQNVSFMSLDESIGKIEVDPKEEASVVEVFQYVLDKLSDVGKKDQLLKFFKLVQDVLVGMMLKTTFTTFTAGNRHKQNSRFYKEIREDNFRFWWGRVHEDAS